MSFLTSLGQYVAGVADSVAGLALSPRRVPPARHRSAEESQQQPHSSAATMRENTSGQDSYDSAHVIQKRTFGVLENAGLGAAAAAVSTFSGSLISTNEASAVAANPNNRGQNYPNQQNYPSQPTNQGHF